MRLLVQDHRKKHVTIIMDTHVIWCFCIHCHHTDPNVDVPDDTTGNTKYIPGGNELESGSGNIDLGLGAGLTDSADSFTACSTLLLLVCVTLVTLLG